ncbi:MAG: hypothetical protein Q9162_005317 [Coniocarpon cinnabarinum]
MPSAYRSRSPPLHLESTPNPPVPPRNRVKAPAARVQAVECEPEVDGLGSLVSEQRPQSRGQRQTSPRPGHPPRQRGSNSSLGNPRWSAFPAPPEGPLHPAPTRPLPQLPPTPTQSLRSRKSSGASKRSTGTQQRPPSAPLDPNNLPPSPPQEFTPGFVSPTGATFLVSDQHTRHPSSNSSSSLGSSNPTVGTFLNAPTLPPQPGLASNSFGQVGLASDGAHRYMTPVWERTAEDHDLNTHVLSSISVRSSNSGSKHASSNDRRSSSSTHSSGHTVKTKKGGVFGSKGLKSLVKGRQPTMIDCVQRNDMQSILNLFNSDKHAPDVNAADGKGKTALHHAAELGHGDVVEFLLNQSAKTELRTKQTHYTPLHLAAEHGHADVIQTLLKHGAAYQAESKYDGATALHKAAHRNHGRAIAVLIDAGADVNLRDAEGMTPLKWATQGKSLQAAHKLLEAGANLDIRIKRGVNLENATAEGSTILDASVNAGDVAFVQIFIQYGADPNAIGPHGLRPLHTAAKKGKLAMVEALVEGGADVHARSKEGLTPLHYAAKEGYRQVCLYLVQQGADAKSRVQKPGDNQQGKTPDELAQENKHYNMLS